MAFVNEVILTKSELERIVSRNNNGKFTFDSEIANYGLGFAIEKVLTVLKLPASWAGIGFAIFSDICALAVKNEAKRWNNYLTQVVTGRATGVKVRMEENVKTDYPKMYRYVTLV